MSYRFHQLELCLESKTKFLNFFTVEENGVSLPERMRACDFIEMLNLIGNEYSILEDISLIENLPDIKTLSFQQITTVKDFESLSNLPNLKKLTIQNSYFDLDIIEKLPLLDELTLDNFSDPAIAIDCEKIAKQTELRHLGLQCVGYYNEDSLSNLKNLTSLNLRCNIPLANAKTLNFLKHFPKLEHLEIEVLVCSGYSDVSALQELPVLKSLKVKTYDAKAELEYQDHDWLTIDFIKNIKSLEKLTLEDCYLLDEEDIQGRLGEVEYIEI